MTKDNKRKSKKHIREIPKAFYSKTPWAGFARGDNPRREAMSICPDKRCQRAKLCIAAHNALFCQRTHLSKGEEKKFNAERQRKFNLLFPAYPPGAPYDLRIERMEAIIAYRKDEEKKLAERWRSGALDDVHGPYRARGALMKVPKREYVEVRPGEQGHR